MLQCVGLIITAKYANLEVFENCMVADDINEGDMDLYIKQSFQETIKDTFQDEIVDSFILWNYITTY